MQCYFRVFMFGMCKFSLVNNSEKFSCKKKNFSTALLQQWQKKINDIKDNIPEKLPGGDSRDELGAMAGVSGKTYEHAVEVINKAPEEVKQACRNGDISINKAYKKVKEAERNADLLFRSA